ncbi:hypothetical protein EMPS_11036 [Entomortierella parvispora]|uniref:Arrestin-like N-terminal domain-containing protein n=1 Tax=Entomortierella parvispora TaxID=205924 RepID=A0A9P3HM12_9FUNG|nr:hypothetical protein EMPS_11036 [Entomortierella parvispora]
MNFLFATNSTPPAQTPQVLSCNTSLSRSSTQTSPSAVSPTPPSTSSQDLELVIEIESSFHGVLLGMPEESSGAVLNATAILHVRKKPIRATKLTATFDGRIKVQCSDGATFGPEQYRERVLAHKDWVLWEAGSNTHNAAAGSGSKNHIPVGTHYYPLSIQLDGALPPTFSGKHGSIRYILSSTLLRPLFYSDVNTVQEIEIKRCLVDSVNHIDGASSSQTRQQDLGSLLLNQLSRASLSDNTRELPTGPTTITHHNTHKELLRYTSSSPPIAHLEGGLIQVDLALEPLPPGSYIYSIAYGLKELIHYRSSATGNAADNKSEILYPIGQQTVIIPRDLERERAMSSAGAGASTRQLLELRPCPLLTNGDIVTPLVEVQHRITCNVAIVLPDSIRRRNTLSGSRTRNRSDSTSDSNGTSSGGGGILRRLNLAPQPLAPSLNLIDSTGSEVANNAVLLGEPTLSIIEPALMPATVELNDAPPPPPSTHIESTLLEFPIILTSRYPSPGRELITSRAEQTPLPEEIAFKTVNNDDFAYQALSSNSYSSSNLATSLHTRPPVAMVPAPPSNFQQFVHNQEIAPSVILTTGTTIQPHHGRMVPAHTGSGTSSSSPRSSLEQELAEGVSAPSTQGSPLSTSADERLPSDPPGPDIESSITNFRGTGHSGISAGLRAAAQSEQHPRLPNYGVQALVDHPVNHPPEDLPKYEDVMDILDTSESGLGITIPHSTPMPMPVPRRTELPSSHSSFSPRFSGSSQSPVMYQPTSSTPRAHVFGSSLSSSPVVLAPESLQTISRDGQRSSPQWNRGHVRTDSAASMLMSTSLVRSQGPTMTNPSMTNPWGMMTPSQASISQQQQHPRQQQQHRHQRQRSVGAATIMGSLGRNGGYLSQQPVSLVMTDSLLTPPAYVE